MKPLAIKDNIFWVGAVDYNSRDFHGYSRSPQGTTYNSYLVKDEKNVLFDTVKEEAAETMLCRIAQVMDPCEIDYIVVNHVELDHSGALPKIMAACKPEKIFCSPLGLKALEGHFDISGWPVEVVKTGDTLSMGKRSVQFLEARMLHWPDSMFSYIPEEKLLICNDAFGQNIACSERFADEIDRSLLEHAIKEYYHNIVQPFAPQVIKIIGQVKDAGLDIDMIAPDHGLIYRGKEDVGFVLDTYLEYAHQPWKKRAVIVFDSMWHSTEKMAGAIGEGLLDVGVPYRLMNIKANHHSAVMTELADSGVVVMGSPTHNNGVLPGIGNILTYMKGLRPQNKIGAAFGSFGWSGEGAQYIHEWLEKMGLELPVAPLKCKFVPKHDTYEKCFAMGQELGRALLRRCHEAGHQG